MQVITDDEPKPLDRFASTRLRVGHVVSFLTAKKERLYIRDMVDLLNALSTRQLNGTKGHQDLYRLRREMRHKDAELDCTSHPECAYWTVHGHKYEDQYFTSNAAAGESNAAAVPALIRQAVLDAAPTGSGVHTPNRTSQKTLKLVEAYQCEVAKLNAQLGTAKMQLADLDALRTRVAELEYLKEATGTCARCNLGIDPSVPDPLQAGAMAELLGDAMDITRRAIIYDGSTSFTHKSPAHKPQIPLLTTQEAIARIGDLPNEVDMWLRDMVRVLRPLWPKVNGRANFHGEKNTDFAKLSTMVDIYRVVNHPAVENPISHVVAHLVRYTLGAEAALTEFITVRAPLNIPRMQELFHECRQFRGGRK